MQREGWEPRELRSEPRGIELGVWVKEFENFTASRTGPFEGFKQGHYKVKFAI